MDGLGKMKNKLITQYYGKDEWVSYLNRSMQFLAKHSWIYSSKNTDIFVKEMLHDIPEEWKQSLLKLSWKDLNQVPYGLIKDEWPSSLKEFLEDAVSFHISQFHPNVDFHSKLEIPSFIHRKMSAKKLMEVKYMAMLISDTCQKLHCDVVLDIGSGLGYLDQVLHHNFGLTVIGLDSIASRTHGAETRIQEGTCNKNVYHSTYMVDNSSECILYLRSLLNEVLKTQAECMCGSTHKKGMENKTKGHGVIMVGLHSCGILVHHMMKLFVQLPEVKAFLCVGCCYHRMSKEEFPISKAAKAALSSTKQSYPEWSPCLYGFRLGSQDSRAHWASRTEEDHILHSKNVAFRGVLQCFLNKENLAWRRPKRRFSKLTSTSSIEDYCSMVLKNLGFSDSGKREKMKDLLEFYSSKEHLFPSIRILALLQVLLQPVWEGLITADRLTYLLENNFDAKIIVMCDELITPRNLAIYGVR